MSIGVSFLMAASAFAAAATTGNEGNATMNQNASGIVDGGPRIVNIINFIRAVEPRVEMDLMEPVVNQIRLAKEHNLPATFLLQYDALIEERFVSLLKSELDDRYEVGAWLEIVQPLVEKAGLKWRGRYPWDWYTHVGFSIGYTPQEREKLIDVFMADFKVVFGAYPRSVGSWFIDAYTLGYLADKYGVIASCNCKDQMGTDGYTLWGGYWNQAYYPSRLNALMPAQNAAQQIPIPVFRMLGSDPIYQYDVNVGTAHQSVVTLEPVYKEGGGSPSWVRWFFNVVTDAPCGAFAYAQVGQENAFGWPAMKDGLTDQIALLEGLSKQGKVRVETLADSAKWYKQQFETTPATCVVAMDDWKGEGRRALWYDSKFYRTSIAWEGDSLRIRDIHLFDERYPERYLDSTVTTNWCVYDTLPILDGFSWSSETELAGIRPVLIGADGNAAPLTGGVPRVSQESAKELRIVWPLKPEGVLTLHCEEDGLRLSAEGVANWALDMTWKTEKTPPIESVEERAVHYRHNGFAYALRLAKGTCARVDNEPHIRITPENGTIELTFGR